MEVGRWSPDPYYELFFHGCDLQPAGDPDEGGNQSDVARSMAGCERAVPIQDGGGVFVAGRG